jgi:hypothetical protein
MALSATRAGWAFTGDHCYRAGLVKILTKWGVISDVVPEFYVFHAYQPLFLAWVLKTLYKQTESYETSTIDRSNFRSCF